MKRCMSLITVVCLIGCSSRVPEILPGQMGQLSETSQATMIARRDAQQDHDGTLGCCLGGCFGVVGIGASYIYKGRIPPHRLNQLKDKSNEYAFVYTEEYIQEAQRLRAKDAIIGHVVILVMSIGFLVMGTAAATTVNY